MQQMGLYISTCDQCTGSMYVCIYILYRSIYIIVYIYTSIYIL